MSTSHNRLKRYYRLQWVILFFLLTTLAVLISLLYMHPPTQTTYVQEATKLPPVTISAVFLAEQPTDPTAEPMNIDTTPLPIVMDATSTAEPILEGMMESDLIYPPTLDNAESLQNIVDGVMTFVGQATPNSEVQILIKSKELEFKETVWADENRQWIYRANLTETGVYKVVVSLPNEEVTYNNTLISIPANRTYATAEECTDPDRGLTQSGSLIDENSYQTAPCETIYHIANHLYVDTTDLRAANPEVDFDNLFPETVLTIPPSR